MLRAVFILQSFNILCACIEYKIYRENLCIHFAYFMLISFSHNTLIETSCYYINIKKTLALLNYSKVETIPLLWALLLCVKSNISFINSIVHEPVGKKHL